MTKAEFMSRTSKPVSDADYKIIEEVYATHPAIDAVKGKDQIANLYETFGMRIIKDMLPTARKAEEMVNKMRDLQRQLEQAKREYNNLVTGYAE